MLYCEKTNLSATQHTSTLLKVWYNRYIRLKTYYVKRIFGAFRDGTGVRCTNARLSQAACRHIFQTARM